jgi:hypothetical protein
MRDIRVAPTLDNILAAVDQMPSTKVETDQGSARVRVGARVVAQIDLRREEVLVNAPSDVVSALRQAFPSSRPAPTGVVFDLADRQDESVALAAIRRRVKVEQLAWQTRVGSP